MKQETLYRHILEAIEADQVVTEKINLRDPDLKLSCAINQLREAGFIDDIFHDIIGGAVVIQDVPTITLIRRSPRRPE